MSPKQALKSMVRFGLHQLGVLNAIVWYHRNTFQILTYHRFIDGGGRDPVEVLEFQCGYIREHFKVVSMSQVGQALQGRGTLPARALAVTVDDGYHDFLDIAFPVFEAYEIPVTVYLISDFIDRLLWLWWDHLEYALQRTNRSHIDVVPSANNVGRRMPLQTPNERLSAYNEVSAALKTVPNQVRLSYMERLPELLGVEIPAEAPPQYGALSWDEIRMMMSSGVEFGAHSKTHPILTSLEDQAVLYAELAESKRRIEEELHSLVGQFCYPNGDFNDDVVSTVKKCGFLSATTLLNGHNTPSSDSYLLKRRLVDPDLTEDYFTETLAGLH